MGCEWGEEVAAETRGAFRRRLVRRGMADIAMVGMHQAGAAEMSLGFGSAPATPTGSLVRSPTGEGTPGVERRKSRGKSAIKLTKGSVKDIGTPKEVLDAATAAVEELRNFANTIPPKPTVFRSLKYGVCVYNMRFLMDWLPFAMVPFTREIVRMGGAERVYLLVTIARLDLNRDGIITQEEYNLSRVAGERCVSNAVAGW